MIKQEKVKEYPKAINDTFIKVKEDRARIRDFVLNNAKYKDAAQIAMGDYGTKDYDDNEVLSMLRGITPKFFDSFIVYGVTNWGVFPELNVKTMPGRFGNFFQYVDPKLYSEFLYEQSKVAKDNDERSLYSVIKCFFTFDNIISISDESVKKLLSEVKPYEMSAALKKSTKAIKNKIFKNMPEKAASILKEDILFTGPLLEPNVLKIQRNIALILSKLFNLQEIEFSDKAIKNAKPLSCSKYYKEDKDANLGGIDNFLNNEFVDSFIYTKDTICLNRMAIRKEIIASAFDENFAKELLCNYGDDNYNINDIGDKFEMCFNAYLDSFYQYAVGAGQNFLMDNVNINKIKGSLNETPDNEKVSDSDKGRAKFSVFIQCVKPENLNNFLNRVKHSTYKGYKIIKKYTFGMDSFLMLDDKSIQKVLRLLDSDDFIFSIYGASDELKEKFFRNCSKKVAEAYIKMLSSLKDVPALKVFRGKQTIIEIVFHFYCNGTFPLFCDKLCM